MKTAPHIIGVKELLQNLKMVYQKIDVGEEFIVVKNSKPAFRIVPVEEKKTQVSKKSHNAFLKKLKKIQFRGNKDLSQNIDSIVYSV